MRPIFSSMILVSTLASLPALAQTAPTTPAPQGYETAACPQDVPLSEVLDNVDRVDFRFRITQQIPRKHDALDLGIVAFKDSQNRDEQVERRIQLHEASSRRRQLSPSRPAMTAESFSADVVYMDSDPSVYSIANTRQNYSEELTLKELIAVWQDVFEITCWNLPVEEASIRDWKTIKGKI
ncbi:MAG: hypothetical protein JNL01_12945 [Bdellovibrionales bacterium]|nr:hypothetical protein [Bdellovibrionales bacterium]